MQTRCVAYARYDSQRAQRSNTNRCMIARGQVRTAALQQAGCAAADSLWQLSSPSRVSPRRAFPRATAPRSPMLLPGASVAGAVSEVRYRRRRLGYVTVLTPYDQGVQVDAGADAFRNRRGSIHPERVLCDHQQGEQGCGQTHRRSARLRQRGQVSLPSSSLVSELQRDKACPTATTPSSPMAF